MREFRDKKVAILGFGLEGKDLAIFLLKQKAKVTVFDCKKEKELDFTGVDINKIALISGENYLKNGLEHFDIVFRSPGVYRYLTEIVKAEKAGVEISSATKLFFDLCPGRIIGVTGTKGKGTTSTLIYKTLKESGREAFLAGNVGYPVMEILPKLNKNSRVILELSSFQLIDLFKSPHISVVLNITTDHLDWHKDRVEYVEAKTNIVRYQKNSDFAVINYDYKDSKKFQKLTEAKVYYFSRKKKVKGTYVKNRNIILNTSNKELNLGNVDRLLLRGEHNWENICAAVSASYLAGSTLPEIKKVIFSFKGLEHRLELVSKVSTISFYNDSFSTNPQTTIAAINSFKEPSTIILGGFEKNLDYDEMARQICKRSVVNVVLIGDIAKRIRESLTKWGFSGKIIDMGYDSMDKIVRKCYSISPKGGVVLLSPASSSFDMFPNYKERGYKFKAAVNKLASE